MVRLDNFHLLIGETLMYCQRIEHDIKIIYSAMLNGDIKDNLKLVEKETLGTVLVALRALDESDSSPMFSKQDYLTLKEIKNIRNFIAHRCYIDFLYLSEEFFNEKLNETYKKLDFYNKTLSSLASLVEKARFSILVKYKFI